MSEEDAATTASEATPEQPEGPQMKILSQYIRDLSFENILVQKGVSDAQQPEIEVSVALDARKLAEEGQYEVVQKYKINAKVKGTDDPMFVLEIEYGGLFQLNNIPDEQIHAYALIECPRMLFPYVRRIVGDVTRDGGFPPLNLESVDFVRLYRQEIQRRAKAQSANSAPI